MSSQELSATTNSSSRPTIFLLSLEKQSFWDEQHSDLVDAIAAKATIKRATNPETAVIYLTNNNPSAIIVTDPAIVKRKPKLTAVSDKVIDYVRSGGTAVLATHFSSFVPPLKLNHWFRARWALPWESGNYHRTTVYLNHDCPRHLDQTALPRDYSQKATFLRNVDKNAAVYMPSHDSAVESRVFPPSPVNPDQTPVVFAKIGQGWLGYVGDVNNESGSQKVILSMCGIGSLV